METLGFATGDRYIITSGSTFQKYKVIEQEKVKIKMRTIDGIDCIGFVNAGHIDCCNLIAKQRMINMINTNNVLSGPELGKVKTHFQHINETI